MGWLLAFVVLLPLVISLIPVGVLLQYRPGEGEIHFTLWKKTFVLYPVVEKKTIPKKKAKKKTSKAPGKTTDLKRDKKPETNSPPVVETKVDLEEGKPSSSDETLRPEQKTKAKEVVRFSKEKPKKKKASDPSLEGQVTMMKEFLPLALFLFQRLGKYKKIDRLELDLVVGASDPVEATLLYGKAHALLGTIWLPLDNALNIEKGRAGVRLEFESVEVSVYAVLAVSMTIGRICYLLGCLGLKGYKIWKAGGEKNG